MIEAGRLAVVTGGGRGIGRAIAVRLDSERRDRACILTLAYINSLSHSKERYQGDERSDSYLFMNTSVNEKGA